MKMLIQYLIPYLEDCDIRKNRPFQKGPYFISKLELTTKPNGVPS